MTLKFDPEASKNAGFMRFYSAQLEVTWPQARKPEDLFEWPNTEYLSDMTPMVPVVAFRNGQSRVYAVSCPFEVEGDYQPGRQVVDRVAKAVLTTPGGAAIQEHEIPDDDVGRIKLLTKLETEEQTGWAAAELMYTKFGAALAGEAEVDGDLGEWGDHRWFPLGESIQARWTRGPEDNRKSPEECYMRWAVKVGEEGIFFAVRGTGYFEKDRFTIFFDTRDPAMLGTPGRYYWISGAFQPDGKIGLGRGETSPRVGGLRGAWKQTDAGRDFEIFMPYSMIELQGWPLFGGRDLGMSIWWVHTGPDGTRTNLMWSEYGHPWNTRWYGVVRLVDAPDEPVPYRVRIK